KPTPVSGPPLPAPAPAPLANRSRYRSQVTEAALVPGSSNSADSPIVLFCRWQRRPEVSRRSQTLFRQKAAVEKPAASLASVAIAAAVVGSTRKRVAR